jgi:hypothetical protein
LFREFVISHFPSVDGRDHVTRFPEECKESRQNLEAIVEAADREEEVANRMLLKLGSGTGSYSSESSSRRSSFL